MYELILIVIGIAIVALLVALVWQSNKQNQKLFNDINKNFVPDEIEKAYKEGMALATKQIELLTAKLHMSVPVKAPGTIPPPEAPKVEESKPYEYPFSPERWLTDNHPEALPLKDAWVLFIAQKGATTPASFPTYWPEFLAVATKA